MKTAKIISISLSSDLNKEVVRIAKEERRTISEVFREALRQYSAGRILSEVRRQARKAAKKKNIRPQDIERIIDEGRK